MKTTEKFSGRANYYTAGRPAYSEKLIEYLYSIGFSEKSVIADIGSGTGIFARQLLAKGSSVICVEPNEDMRSAAERELSSFEKFTSVNGTASDTTLESSSIDFITCAQAFHWFDILEFQTECNRILKPNGVVVLIWNTRDMEADVNKECAEISKKYCPAFQGFNGGMNNNPERIGQFFNKDYETVVFENDLIYDEEKFINRMLSSSYALKPDDSDYQKYIEELMNVFNKYSTDGILLLPNNTIAYLGNIKRAGN